MGFEQISNKRGFRLYKSISEKMMKTQLVYNVRKKALETLTTILNTENYKDLLRKFIEFRYSIDWIYFPIDLKLKIETS